MQVFGVLLMVWGLADFILSWMGTDVYWELGINIPTVIWPFTAWIAIGIGGLLYRSGSKS